MTTPISKPKPSSTVVIMRQGKSFEVLMVRRNPALKTNGGAWVFPGGAIEEADIIDGQDDYQTAANAARRESLEETNIDLSNAHLTPYSHWVTPTNIPRRYATWFYLAEIAGDCAVTVDGSEIIDYRWLTPKQILIQHRQGELPLTPPTFVTLTELNALSDSTSALNFASTRQVPTYRPKLAQSGPTRIILYEEDVAYESTDLSLAGKMHRLIMSGNDWHYHALH